MVDFHKLKNLGTDLLGRAGEIAEQAKDKVAPLAEQAKDKVAPLAEQAKDKVVPLAGKAKDAAAKGVDKAAGGLDSATGHKFHDKLGDVTGNREKQPSTVASNAGTSTADVSTNEPAPDLDADDDVVGAAADESLSTELATGNDSVTNEPVAGDSTSESPVSDGFTADEPVAGTPAAGELGLSELGAASVDAAVDAPPALDDVASAAEDHAEHHPTPADMPQHRDTES